MAGTPSSPLFRSPLRPERRPSPGPGPAADASGRDPFFDNAKYLAIVLVACGHAWEPFRSDSRAATALYMLVYAFHLPVFIVISGYFSRGFDLGPRGLRRLVTGVLVPYLVFETAYALFRRWADDDPAYPINVLDPWFLNWFLIALFVWRLSAPLWRLVRWPLPLAVGIGLLGSVTPGIGPALDLQRILQFLPFFVLGTLLRPEHFAAVRRRAVRWAALPVAAGAPALAYWAEPRVNHQWFYHRDSAQELGATALTGGVVNLALLACSLVLTVCFLSWVPGRATWFTPLGAGTLYGFLLHGFVFKGAVFGGWYDRPWLHTPLGMVAVTLLAAAGVTLLCTAPVRRLFRWAVEPRMDWLFRADPAAGARRRLERSRAPERGGAAEDGDGAKDGDGASSCDRR